MASILFYGTWIAFAIMLGDRALGNNVSLAADAAAAQEFELFNQAIEYSSQGEIRKSARLLARLVRAHPNESLYWFNLANAHFKLRTYNSAITHYERVIALRGPLEWPARIYMAKAYRKKGQLEHAYHALVSMAQANLPPNLSTQLEQEKTELESRLLDSGFKEYRQYRYSEAMANVARALSLRPSTQGEFLRGLIHWQRQDYPAAKRSFEYVIRYPSSEDLRKEAQSFMSRLSTEDEGAVSRKGLTLSLFSAAGYNSNYYADGESEEITGRPVGSLTANLGTSLYRSSRLEVTAGYVLEIDEIVGFPADRAIRNNVLLGTKAYYGGWLAQVSPSYQHELANGEPALSKPGLGLGLERRIDNNYLGVTFDYQRSLAIDDYYRDLEGSYQGYKVYWNHERRSWSATLALRYFEDQTQDLILSYGELPLANHSLGPILGFSWQPNDNWDLSLRYTFLTRVYTLPVALTGERRLDRQSIGTLNISRGIGTVIKLFASAQATYNRSNFGDLAVDDKNYVQWVYLAGMTWEILR
jgi:hypothetical protein